MPDNSRQNSAYSSRHRHAYSLALIAICAAVTAAGAQIQIPLFVPITLQVFGVFLAAFLLGSAKGAIAMLVYLLLGFAGLPVFAGAKGGLSIIATPTLGYLIAFPIAAFVIGIFAGATKKHRLNASLAIVTGIIIIYTSGVVGILLWGKFIAQKPMTLWTALSVGVLPFIPFDIMKGIAAYFIVKALPKKLRRTF